ncbi:MAG: hypothetical protein AMJ56_16075 [Anaerolineae bacterium SG8_19]|jgi:two-component system sensor histidine kinase/response regulator|nr:MAG: hypothetical protein AMJ56_16075 [Anaerolineae bacterium SG8_19]
MEDTARVLIVDDELSALYTLEMLLTPEPYDIKLANSPEEAFVTLESDPPDVILLDVMMPGITGYEVCQRLKGDDRWRHIPIILVTALDSKDDLVRGLNSGADEFISKPVNGPEMRARVRSMLRIKQQYDDIQEAMHLREELANMIVHDMRTPISAIVLYIDLLSRLYDSSDHHKRVVPKLRSQAQRLNSMLTDMLLVAKMKSGKLVLNCSPVNIVELVETAVQDQKAVAESKRITVVTDLPNDVQLMSLDSKLIQRTLENLLSNALKFSPEDSTVTVHLAYGKPGPSSNGHQPRLRLQVTDEGPGIPEEFRESIFDRYEVVKMKTADIPQVGIGLAFCKMVVEAHGGTISVNDNQPQGAVFTVEL